MNIMFMIEVNLHGITSKCGEKKIREWKSRSVAHICFECGQLKILVDIEVQETII